MNKMNKYAYIFLGFIIISLAIFVVFRSISGDVSSNAETTQPKTEQVVVQKDDKLMERRKEFLKDTSGDYFLGKEFAPVVMVEYASLSCPHCADFHEKVVEPMIPNYVDTGKVKYVFRDFPLNKSALDATKLAHCAETDKYFSFIKVLFKSQKQWAYNEQYLPILKDIAKLGGLTPEKVDTCLADKKLEDKIFKVQQDAVDILEVKSTPTIYINGNKYDGPHKYEDVEAFINKQLKGE